LPVGGWKALVGETGAPPPPKVYEAAGCGLCGGTGYKGRAGVYELMTLNEAITAAIGPALDLPRVHKLACSAGMRSLRLAAARLVEAGRTSLAEALRVAPAQP
jgi:general secretion pathway protein E